MHRKRSLLKLRRWPIVIIFLLTCYIGLLVRLSDFLEFSSLDASAKRQSPSPNTIQRRRIEQAGQSRGDEKCTSNKRLLLSNAESLQISGTKDDLPEQQQRAIATTMKALSQRVLSRNISSSNVLVLSPDAVESTKTGISLERRMNSANESKLESYGGAIWSSENAGWSMGSNFLLDAAREGHSLHGIGFRGVNESEALDMDRWWASFSEHNPTTTNSSPPRRRNWQSSTLDKPKWIIATVIDTTHSMANTLKLDSLWETPDVFLSEVTMTYIVSTMKSRKVGNAFQFAGMSAAGHLLRHRYKIQVLFLSHDLSGYASVNMHLKTLEQMAEFLQKGAERADNISPGSTFTCLLFATQGLDLAVPAPEIYISDQEEPAPIDPSIEFLSHSTTPLKACPQALHDVQLDLSFTEVNGIDSLRLVLPSQTTPQILQQTNDEQLRSVSTGETFLYSTSMDVVESSCSEHVHIWLSDESLQDSEAACLLWKGHSRCTTRVLDRHQEPNDSSSARDQNVPNILLIMIDPISRPHFRRTMPSTRDALQQLGFVEFTNYTAVGPNSGKNQAALYSGEALADRDGIQTKGGKWLWDQLRDEEGFITLKAEDGCIENSNMVKSLNPQTTHGESLTGMFCFDFDRPNCVGPELASQHLIRYGEDFLSTYEALRNEVDPSLRWAAFLHFIDTHEDSMILPLVLDTQLAPFLRRLETNQEVLEDTMVIVTSDHGLHYGPYFQTPSGRREATEPILHIRLPNTFHDTGREGQLRKNADRWTTAFDVHETLLSMAKIQKGSPNRRGKSLLKPLPKDRSSCWDTNEIPNEYCRRQLV